MRRAPHRHDQSFLPNYALNERKVRTFLSCARRARRLPDEFLVPSPRAAASVARARFALASLVAARLDALPSLDVSSSVERIATVALIVILFDGGASIGLRRFRAAAVPIALARRARAPSRPPGSSRGFAHWALGLGWMTAGPARRRGRADRSGGDVLGARRPRDRGRTGTILEGESGANDPVGIALMLGLIELATHADATLLDRRARLRRADGDRARGRHRGRLRSRRACCPASAARPRGSTRRTLALAGSSTASRRVAHGSGFLAVFVAGLIVGDVEAPVRPRSMRLQEAARDARRDRRLRRARPDDRASRASAPAAGPRASLIAAFVALVARPAVVARRSSRRVRLDVGRAAVRRSGAA